MPDDDRRPARDRRPGDRLADFASSFGAHGLFRSVCRPDYGQARRMLDDHTPDPSSPRPCARFAIDPSCATETRLAVHVERVAAPREGTVEQISCAAR